MTRPQLPAMVASLCLAGCQPGNPPHPLASLALPAHQAPPPCELATDARPMFMLPEDPTWDRDLEMTIGWWTGPNVPAEDLDAALSHMLRLKEETRPHKPTVLIIAMRFKEPKLADDMKSHIQSQYPDHKRAGLSVAVEGRVLLLQAPIGELSPECAKSLWTEQRSRLESVAQ